MNRRDLGSQPAPETLATLNDRERLELLDCLRQAGGPELSEDAFRDAVCQLLEDVPGFEVPDEDLLEKLLVELREQFVGLR
ncbi:hypothetical protein [Burkholderia vietnamiensis]|uniref:hypothetical protein n=1 Tax=Burkholderia vietnamiensis TaxID=60552 RepID=UPI001D148067|nr:hypothetical protein [Burkholderia vietnamiensis]UEC01714.1 hypothetical protein LK462_06715 [Burkholderia vietnamiensis]